MAHRPFLVVRALVRHGGLVPVAVLGKALVVVQPRDVRQTVVQPGVGFFEQGQADVAQEGAAAGAAPGGEVVVRWGRGVETRAVFRQEGAPAFASFQHALHPPCG